MGGYWKVVNETRDATIVVLRDTAENILGRITFYDMNFRPVPMNLTGREKGLYLREIKRDIAYFSRSFCRAHMSVDITGCSPDEASRKVREALILALGELLVCAAEREARQIDEKLFLETCSSPAAETRTATGRRR